MKTFWESLRVNKLFVKILLSFLSFLLPLVALGTLTYTNFVAGLKQDYAEKLRLNLTASTDTIESFWQRIHETSTSFFSDSNVLRLMKPRSQWSEADRANLMYLRASINKAKFHVNTFVEELFAYVDDQYVFNDNGINDFKPYFNKYYSYQGYDDDYWTDLLDTVSYVDILGPRQVNTSFGGQSVITFLTASQIGNHRAILAATVQVNKIWRTLAPILDHGTSRIVVADNDGRLVMASDPEFDNEGALAAILKRTADAEAGLNSDSSATELAVGGNRYMTEQSAMSSIGWTFYTLTPVEAFNQQASGILNFVVSLCIILCIISVIFAFVFSYRLYTPIRRIGEALESGSAGERDIGEGGRSSLDLQHIGAGINRLLHHQSEYRSQMELLTQEYLDQSLLQLVQGSLFSKEQQDNLMQVMRSRLSFGQDGFLCCAVSLRFKERFLVEIQDVERIVIENKMKNLLQGLMKEYGSAYVLETGDSLYIILFNVSPDDSLHSIKAGMHELVDIFSSDWKYCQLHIGIGSVRQGMEGIARSYRDGVAALHQITNEPDYRIVEHTGTDPACEPVYTHADENRLFQLLRIGHKDGSAELIEELARRKNDAPHSLNSLFTHLFETGRRFLLEQGEDARELLTADEQRLLLQPGRLPMLYDERKRVLVSFFHRIIDRTVSVGTPRKPSDLAATIKAYVEEHYTSDLHLEKIAEEMGVSLKYVSRLFKETYNVNITSFISELRIDKAKQLLRDTDLLVAAISRQVGIFDRTTFLRTFKKLEGLSPNDYRRQARATRKQEERDGR
ncbi:helix-turn-helix domain-containing protein [Cohnella hongkongensis]|uniref:Helix-turn-helix domain-containing protein n=1 Tax=Cohnella hongkongensis TaxID=178337 RepID=A0ABV9FEZ0_9BACL